MNVAGNFARGQQQAWEPVPPPMLGDFARSDRPDLYGRRPPRQTWSVAANSLTSASQFVIAHGVEGPNAGAAATYAARVQLQETVGYPR